MATPQLELQVPQRGENVAAGISSAEEAVEEWIGSPEHHANILGGYRQTGVAYAQARFSRHGSLCVQVFGTPLHPNGTEVKSLRNP